MQPTNALDLINDDVAKQSEEAAKALIQQAGWDIVNGMARAVAEGINSTALVVLPVKVNLEKYKAQLSDPEGFEAKFNTLTVDVTKVTAAMVALFEQHQDRKGAPKDDAENKLIGAITMGYTKIQGHLETTIHPLMLNIVSDLEAAGINELTVEGEQNVA